MHYWLCLVNWTPIIVGASASKRCMPIIMVLCYVHIRIAIHQTYYYPLRHIIGMVSNFTVFCSKTDKNVQYMTYVHTSYAWNKANQSQIQITQIC